MNHWGMIIGGYVVVFGVVLGYAALVIWRGRRLAAQLGLDARDNSGVPARGIDMGVNHEESPWDQ